MQIRPLYDRVVVRRLEAETTTKGGIVLPGKAADKPSQGIIIAVGQGVLRENGVQYPLTVQVGDRVVFEKHAGIDIKLNNETCLVIRESEILAVIDNVDAQEKVA
ncbi:co-chaperone GroES [Marinobacter halodurans]|uniref:Co-chaperonin GroES n=1 Tax=Marinobacter halodurans TaxID=2528979 RepID=A0ABY1ZF75_9GAMM|nr:co-chaperone GroES [Marinobacter halodurans]TBW49381.1 co-chaperone GroES [Marinobacter halodurans]